jgi:anthranilate/para-aminobenzoate synthase component I
VWKLSSAAISKQNVSQNPWKLARSLSKRDGPFLFFDSGRGTGRSYVFADPVAEFDGPGSELPVWLREQIGRGRTVAGVLGFELAWQLDSIRAPEPAGDFPHVWVGAFEGPVAAGQTPRNPETGAMPGSWSPSLDISREAYERNVALAVEAIWSGELFEVNYTERFRGSWAASPWSMYEHMRRQSTGDYFGFAQFGGWSVASVSPEEFLRGDDGRVVTRPIKGTMRRDRDPAADQAAAAALEASPKDRAENIMIVDLMRNDLTRYCEPGTVHASEICAVESFAGWHHLVSTVEGRLDDGVVSTDLLVASFPPGSITGAPKLRSVELIAELEASARGAYTGTMFFANASTLRSNVLIRTAMIRDGEAEYGAGGAIVADSDPNAEYEEAVLKARPFLSLTREDTDGS